MASAHPEVDDVPLGGGLLFSRLVEGAYDHVVLPTRQLRAVREAPLRPALRQQQDRAPTAAAGSQLPVALQEAAPAPADELGDGGVDPLQAPAVAQRPRLVLRASSG